ncbi:hypothetical protein CLV62_112122 [Dysgonomonas alginatilytica]|uniref:Uncharacterized protein n=1 Tax=Dysgonomonas alginatilytica TaxID=1605892 RepID=A0A2V3PN76_9BACT|nr:hypothetical protein CLV62_112122 [Dysgonomonas alginatilytica]
MINIHWNIIIYAIALIISVGYLLFVKEEYGYLPDLRKPILFVVFIIYTLIWGGIFWW